MTRQEIANTLREAGKIIFTKEELHPQIHEMSVDIFNNPKKNYGRTFDQVYNHTSYIAIEFALAKALHGIRNPLEFDHLNPESFKYDVIADDKLFEVKRHDINCHWFSYDIAKIQTFKKYAGSIDYVVTAYMNVYADRYEIEFALIADAPTFFDHFKQSKYPNQLHYYDHKTAIKYSKCDKIGNAGQIGRYHKEYMKESSWNKIKLNEHQ